MNLKKLKIKDSAENKTLLAVREAIATSPSFESAIVTATEIEPVIQHRIQIEETSGPMSDELRQQLEATLEADGYTELHAYRKNGIYYTIWSQG